MLLPAHARSKCHVSFMPAAKIWSALFALCVWANASPAQANGLNDALRQAHLTCGADPAHCPDGVGLVGFALRSIGSVSLAQCTGFLIADNVVATASHCIPDDVKEGDADCDKNVMFRFVNSDSTNKVYACKRLIQSSGVRPFTPDYAYFEIEPTGRKPFELAREGIGEHEALVAVGIDPTHMPDLGGVLVTSTCQTEFNSMLNPMARGPWSPTQLALNCRVLHGHSGGPILDSEGRVVGIIQSYVGERLFANMKALYPNLNLILPPDALPVHGQFTNASCLPNPGTNEIRAECRTHDSIAADLCAMIQPEVERWESDLPKTLRYDIRVEGALTFKAKPVCILPNAAASEVAFVRELELKQTVRLNASLGIESKTIELAETRSIVAADSLHVCTSLQVQTPTLMPSCRLHLQ